MEGETSWLAGLASLNDNGVNWLLLLQAAKAASLILVPLKRSWPGLDNLGPDN